MRSMPRLADGAKQQLMTTTFLGYNHNEVIRDGEMYDMKNLSGDQYPLLTLRKRRAGADFSDLGALTGINGRDQLTFVLGTRVFWNFTEVNGLRVSDSAGMNPKTIVNFGAYVLIFPDRKYFNTVDLSDYGEIDRPFVLDGTNVSLTMCRGDGTDYDMQSIDVSSTEPQNPTNGKLWIDQSGENDVLRQWSETTAEWVEVATTFVKVGATGIGHGINTYDALTISGLAPDTENERLLAQVAALNGSKIVYAAGENYIVLSGIISQTQAALVAGDVRADRSMPDMDHIVESNNRLWGCRYGMQEDGSVVNELYASALGDFRNWRRYLGNSQDSYTAGVGTDGPFTGAVVLSGYPVFFKENCIHLVYGNTPSSFQIKTVMCRGIQRGSSRSAVVVNERAYYKSRTDVMMFDGSMPVSVSEQLGGASYSDARAGALGNKYYISMQDAGGAWALFTFDTDKGVWYKEDSFQALGFGKVGDELYAVNESDGLLWRMRPADDVAENIAWQTDPEEPGDEPEDEEDEITWTQEDPLQWKAEFGLFGTDYKGQKYLSRFDIRMYIEEGTTATLQIQYDSDGIWRDRGEITGNRLRSFVLPVVPVRCDHLRFRITGTGEMRIYSISRILEGASDG